MAPVDFDHIEAGLDGALGSFGIFLDNVEDFAFFQRTRCRIAFFGRNRRCRNGLKTVQSFWISGSAGVVELDRSQGAVLMDAFRQFVETWDELLVVDAQLFGAVRGQGIVDTGVFDDNQGCAAAGAEAVVVFHIF